MACFGIHCVPSLAPPQLLLLLLLSLPHPPVVPNTLNKPTSPVGFFPTLLEDVPDMAVKFAAYESMRQLHRSMNEGRAASPQVRFCFLWGMRGEEGYCRAHTQLCTAAAGAGMDEADLSPDTRVGWQPRERSCNLRLQPTLVCGESTLVGVSCHWARNQQQGQGTCNTCQVYRARSLNTHMHIPTHSAYTPSCIIVLVHLYDDVSSGVKCCTVCGCVSAPVCGWFGQEGLQAFLDA